MKEWWWVLLLLGGIDKDTGVLIFDRGWKREQISGGADVPMLGH